MKTGIGAEPLSTERPRSIIDAILEAEAHLRLASVTETARLEAEVLLADVLRIERTKLIALYPEYLNEAQHVKYRSVMRRRLSGEPLAYIIGKKEFMGLTLAIDNRALIPRPETETLVEYLIARVHGGTCKSDLILDIGTGCGCIAVSLAYYIPRASIFATDISPAAVALARKNADQHHVSQRITFSVGDCLAAVPQSFRGTCDIIVSNPPYIADGDYFELARSIRDFEPATALRGGPDGLNMVRQLATDAADYLNRDGVLALEIGDTQADEAAEILKRTRAFASIEIIPDLGQRPRVIIGQKE